MFIEVCPCLHVCVCVCVLVFQRVVRHVEFFSKTLTTEKTPPLKQNVRASTGQERQENPRSQRPDLHRIKHLEPTLMEL